MSEYDELSPNVLFLALADAGVIEDHYS